MYRQIEILREVRSSKSGTGINLPLFTDFPSLNFSWCNIPLSATGEMALDFLASARFSSWVVNCEYEYILTFALADSMMDALSAWHLYRIPIILSTLAILLLTRTLLYLRFGRDKIVYTPPPSSPALPVAQGKPPVPDLKAIPPVNELKKKASRTKRVVGGLNANKESSPKVLDHQKIQLLVFFSSLTGGTERIAKDFTAKLSQSTTWGSDSISSLFIEPQVHDLSYIDYDDYFLNLPKFNRVEAATKYFYLLLLPTYNIDTVLDSFLEHLQETHNDFRIDTAPLSPLIGYSVFGFGDREGWPTEAAGFCSQAREVDKWMAKLTGRKRAFPLGMGDSKTDAAERFQEWTEGVRDVIENVVQTGALGEGVAGSGDPVESDAEDIDEDDEDPALDEETIEKPKPQPKKKNNLDDLEDLGRMIQGSQPMAEKLDTPGPIAIDFTTYSKKARSNTTITKEMVPKASPTYTALTKQGYTIVGSHSGVKICRWTKSALRGRGSCYKYSFYGIASHQCMETTPSLSCSNKCVFCWRHGTNPVGTTWRWVVDPPELIFNGVKEGHYKKIKMMRGVPGVRAERFAEALKIRHCALSLVGEPIFYPHINEFTAMLHKEHISSFLVCNAQHPDQLATLKPVTQLYVSIDASNRESLRKIDRPLHRDFWERFQRCLDILREKRHRQRTVFRLTLVKGFNIEDEVEGYADLVERGLPCFVEVKGVTYCGTSSSAGAGLTMQNVPFYEEVCSFVEALNAALARRGLAYGIAAEHAHSCCILIASERFKVDGRWHTRIDYEKFFELLESGKEFSPEDYRGPETPEWATWGNGGFDPRDERVYRKGKNKQPLAEEKSGSLMEVDA
jgi:tRNA wybutosine-synthesizing protein 1